jgi:2-keto-4-pentenoate hydratase
MTLRIAFDVKLKGKHVRGGIEWEGTRAEILALMRYVEQRAAAGGCTPELLVQSVYAHLPTMGLRDERVKGDFQRSLMVYGVVRYADKYASATMAAGSLVDLVEVHDINAKVKMRGNKTHHELSMEINGAPLPEIVWH